MDRRILRFGFNHALDSITLWIQSHFGFNNTLDSITLWIQSRLERTSTSAGLDRVGVFESEPLFFQALEPVDGRAVEVEGTLLVDDHRDTVALILAVDFLVEALIEVQCVIEAAATTASHSDSQNHALVKVVLGLVSLDFLCGSFGQFDCHF